MNQIELILQIVGVLFALLTFLLFTLKNRKGYITSMISFPFLFSLFYLKGLHADMVLQLYFLSQAFIGYRKWKPTPTGLVFRHIPVFTRYATIIPVWTILWLIIYWIQSQTGANLPVMTSVGVAGYIITTYLMARKYKEAFVMQLLIDLVYIWVFGYLQMYWLVAAHVAFFGMACYGIFNVLIRSDK